MRLTSSNPQTSIASPSPSRDGLFSSCSDKDRLLLKTVYFPFLYAPPFSTFFHLFPLHFCTPEVWGVISWFFRVPRSTAKSSRSTAKSIRSTEINRGSTVCPRFVHGSVGMWAFETFESMTYREVLGKGKKTGAKEQKTAVVRRRFIFQSRKAREAFFRFDSIFVSAKVTDSCPVCRKDLKAKEWQSQWKELRKGVILPKFAPPLWALPMCVNVLFPIIWCNDHKIILCIYAIISNYWVLEFSHKGFLNVAGILRLALPGRHHRRSWGWTTKKVPWLMLLAGAIARDFCQMFMVVECSIAVVCMMHVACPWKVFEWTSFCFVRCLSTSPTQRSDWSASAQENSWDVEKCCRMCKSLNLVSGSFWGRYEQTCFVETAQTLLRSRSRRVIFFVASPFSCAWELNDNSCLFILKSYTYTVSAYSVIIYTSNWRSRNLCSACAIMSRRRRSSDFVGKKTGKNQGASIAGMGCHETLLNPTGPSEM